MKTFLLILLTILSLSCIAQVYESGSFKVESMRIEQSSVKIRFSPAPENCQGGDNYRMHAIIPYSQNGSKEMISALLAAYTSGNTIKYVFFSNEGSACSPSKILNLDMFELEYK